jgi:hypothetical protein
MYPLHRPCSFTEAVDTYNVIKPARGKYAGYDVRPLGRRSNQHERIVKIDENTYALWPTSHWWCDTMNFDLEDARIRAAVLWRHTADGDFVHVRNDWFNGGHQAHYRFLTEVLPRGLTFITQNGKQYILQNRALTKHYLPHDSWFGGSYAKHISGNPNKPTEPDTSTITPELVFQHKGGDKFELVSDEHTETKKAVNLELKKALLPSIRAFKEWALVVAPMLNLKPVWVWNAREEPTYKMAHEAHMAQHRTDEVLLRDWSHDNGYGKIYTMRNVAPKLIRQMVENEDHPMRVVLAKYVLDVCGYTQLWDNVRRSAYSAAEARTKFGTTFNYHMNQLLGLVEEK